MADRTPAELAQRLASLGRALAAGADPPPFGQVVAGRGRGRAGGQALGLAAGLALAVGVAVGVAAVAVAGAVLAGSLRAAPATTPAAAGGSGDWQHPTVRLPGSGGGAEDLSFADSRRGLVLVRSCRPACQLLALPTSDGGQRLGPPAQVAPPGAPGADRLGFVTFTRTVFAYGPGLYASTDAGRRWSAVPLPVPGRVESVATSPHQVWVLLTRCGAAGCRPWVLTGTLGRHGVGALTPLAEQPGGGGASSSLFLPAPRFAVLLVTGAAGGRLATFDGTTWTTVPDPCPDNEDQQLSVFAGSWWLLCRTAAGPRLFVGGPGLGWRPRPAPPALAGDSLVATGTGTAYLAGGPAGLRVTRDGGDSWHPAGPGLGTGRFGQPHFVRLAGTGTAPHGWVLGPGGRLWLTGDGGLSWHPGPVAAVRTATSAAAGAARGATG